MRTVYVEGTVWSAFQKDLVVEEGQFITGPQDIHNKVHSKGKELQGM